VGGVLEPVRLRLGPLAESIHYNGSKLAKVRGAFSDGGFFVAFDRTRFFCSEK
jgi:hypothetical protein